MTNAQQLDMFGDAKPVAPAQRSGALFLLPPNPRFGRCKSCGADIVWVTTPTGAHMPLSAALIERRDGRRYAPAHWGDCPHAAAHRKDARAVTLATGERVLVDDRGREVVAHGRAPDAPVAPQEAPGEANAPDPALRTVCERAEAIGATIDYHRATTPGVVWCQAPAGFSHAWMTVDAARLLKLCDAWEEKPVAGDPHPIASDGHEGWLDETAS